MELGYSEFSFGYACTENMIRSSVSGPKNAPFFPNLVQEGKLGYDVCIDLPASPIILQFKIPKLMKHNSAPAIRKHKLAGISTPFFQMPIMNRNRSQQHAILLKLDSKMPGSVFYATPHLDGTKAFNNSYRRVNVHCDTAYISPCDIGRICDNKSHNIVYMQNGTEGWLCSTPRKIPILDCNMLNEIAQHKFNYEKYMKFTETVNSVCEVIRESLPKSILQAEDEIVGRLAYGLTSGTKGDDFIAIRRLIVTRVLARIGLGLDVLIAQPRK